MTTPVPQASQGPAATAAVIQAVANAVGKALSARCVILFGSRARGDHHEGSDIDLAVIFGGAAPDPKLRRDEVDAAIESVRSTANGQFPRIDVIGWTEEEYRLKKRSMNHVAGRAWREGRMPYTVRDPRRPSRRRSSVGIGQRQAIDDAVSPASTSTRMCRSRLWTARPCSNE